jgi:hypothetical protein
MRPFAERANSVRSRLSAGLGQIGVRFRRADWFRVEGTTYPALDWVPNRI